MRRTRSLLGVLGLVIALVLAGRAWATRDDATVCQFSGPARVHLAPAPPSTRVEAWVDGEKVAETEVVSQGDESIYTFTLDRRYAGKTVVFRFPAYPQLGQAGRATCELDQRQTLTLYAQSHTGCGGG